MQWQDKTLHQLLQKIKIKNISTMIFDILQPFGILFIPFSKAGNCIDGRLN